MILVKKQQLCWPDDHHHGPTRPLWTWLLKNSGFFSPRTNQGRVSDQDSGVPVPGLEAEQRSRVPDRFRTLAKPRRRLDHRHQVGPRRRPRLEADRCPRSLPSRFGWGCEECWQRYKPRSTLKLLLFVESQSILSVEAIDLSNSKDGETNPLWPMSWHRFNNLYD